MYIEKYIDLIFVEETEILNEIHLSKKDLQDPKSVEKCINQAHKFDNILKGIKWVLFVFTLLLIIPSLGTILVPMTKIMEMINGYPITRGEKNLSKLRKKAEELMNKTDDPKMKTNCKQVIKAVDGYYKDLENKQFMDDVDYALKTYELLVDYMQDKGAVNTREIDYDYFLIGNLLALAKELKIPENAFYNLWKTSKHNYYKMTEKEQKSICKDLNEKDLVRLKKAIPEITDGTPYKVIAHNDEWDCVYSKKRNKLIEIDYSKPMSIDDSSPYKIANMNDVPPRKAIIEADKKMGYYLIAKCPESVKKKEPFWK